MLTLVIRYIDDVPTLCDEQTGEPISDVVGLSLDVQPSGAVVAEARIVLVHRPSTR